MGPAVEEYGLAGGGGSGRGGGRAGIIGGGGHVEARESPVGFEEECGEGRAGGLVVDGGGGSGCGGDGWREDGYGGHVGCECN